MTSPSPTAQGFRLIFRRPVIPLAEIAWRWTFAVAVWFLGAGFLIEYTNGLPVNTVDRLLLRSRQPALIGQAIERIFHGSALRFTETGVLLAIAVTLAWIALASVGRAATVKALIEELGMAPAEAMRRAIPSLLALNFLRAAVTLAAIVGCSGAILLASSLWAFTHASLADATRLWLALLLATWIAWAVLNWFISTAALFVVRDRSRAFTAIGLAVGFCRDRLGHVVATAVWFGLAHTGAFILACSAAFTVLGMAGALRLGPTLFLEFLIAGVYCAVADFLYIARLTSYLAIMRDPEMNLQRLGEIFPSGPTNEQSTIDQRELILSDVPVPAV